MYVFLVARFKNRTYSAEKPAGTGRNLPRHRISCSLEPRFPEKSTRKNAQITHLSQSRLIILHHLSRECKCFFKKSETFFNKKIPGKPSRHAGFRGSEKTGVFQKTAAIIRFLIQIPYRVGGALFFSTSSAYIPLFYPLTGFPFASNRTVSPPFTAENVPSSRAEMLSNSSDSFFPS